MTLTAPIETTTEITAQLRAHLDRGGAFRFTQWFGKDGNGYTKWTPTSESYAPALKLNGKSNVYWGVNPTYCTVTDEDRAKKPGKSDTDIEQYIASKNHTVVAINALYAEFDGKDFTKPTEKQIDRQYAAIVLDAPDANAKVAMTQARAQVKEQIFLADMATYKAKALQHIESLALAPSVIVDSGGGYQCYWLLAYTYTITDDDQRAFAKWLQAAWVEFVSGDMGAKDLRRILREPGFENIKKAYGPKFPVVSYITAQLDRLYNTTDFTAILPKREPPKTTPAKAPAPLATHRTGYNGESVIEAFNASHKITDMLLSVGYGWVGDRMHKPGGRNGTVAIYEDDNQSFHHGGEDLLSTGHRVNPFNVYTCYNHNGNYRAAVKAAAELLGMTRKPINASGADGLGGGVEHTVLSVAGKQVEPQPTEIATVDPNTPVVYPSKPARSRYSIEGGCIGKWSTKKNDDGQEVEEFEPYCNFNAWIVADVMADDGEEISRRIIVAGELANGTPLPEIEIAAADFEAMKWPVARWGARVIISPMVRNVVGNLRAAIQELSAERMTDRRTMTHTGWTITAGRRVFLHAGGALGADDMSVSLPQPLHGYHFPSDDAISSADAMRESLKLLDVAPTWVSAPIWAAMYLGPLSEIITPVFTVAIEGSSGALKSSYAAVMLNHYGAKFTEKTMPADWISTVNSLEKLCFHAKDIPLVIDDFRPSSSATEAKDLQDKVSRIIRAVGNRQGRSRLTGESEFKRTFTPRGVVLMTAERRALGKSVNSRILTVEVEPGDIDSRKLATAQKQAKVYSYAMRGFIEWVALNYEILSDSLPEQVIEQRTANSANGYHKRLPNATAILYAAFGCAMRYAVEIGAISQSEADRRNDECLNALHGIETRQSEATENEDPAHKYVTILASLIAGEKAHIDAKALSKAERERLGLPETVTRVLGKGITEKLGWHDTQNVYLLPSAYTAVCQQARAEGWSFPSDEVTLRKELERTGWITATEHERNTIQKREPGGGKVRVTALSYSKFAGVLEAMGYDFTVGKDIAAEPEGLSTSMRKVA